MELEELVDAVLQHVPEGERPSTTDLLHGHYWAGVLSMPDGTHFAPLLEDGMVVQMHPDGSQTYWCEGAEL